MLIKEPPALENTIFELKYDGWMSGIFKANNKTYNATLTVTKKIPIGTHLIMRPDHPHDKSARYVSDGKLVWFPIHVTGEDLSRERYVHIGQASNECITITDVKKWGELYRYMISRKQGSLDSNIIGKLIVKA